MSNRSQRRADIAIARSELGGAFLWTWLVPADEEVADPLLARAVSKWRSSVQQQRQCAACRADFGDGAQVGMLLLARPPSAAWASVMAYCHDCRDTLTFNEVETVAVRALRRLIPHGRFLDGAS